MRWLVWAETNKHKQIQHTLTEEYSPTMNIKTEEEENLKKLCEGCYCRVSAQQPKKIWKIWWAYTTHANFRILATVKDNINFFTLIAYPYLQPRPRPPHPGELREGRRGLAHAGYYFHPVLASLRQPIQTHSKQY